MQQETINQRYQTWKRRAVEDTDVSAQLQQMEKRPEEIEDAFYQDLSFGTGGLRGIIGAGTNRMNIYTVRRASQGLAEYVISNFSVENRKVAVSYDSRIKSRLFAQAAAGVFAANGIQVHIFRELMPTPCLSFAVRQLHCSAGVMITASHNPAQYNGYKVYGADGCQITSQAAEKIMSEIENVDMFDGVCFMAFNQGMDTGSICYIEENVISAFIEAVKEQTILGPDCEIRRDFPIVYSPLNGTGRLPVTRILRECGFCNVHMVKEQELPDGTFPTCPYPNPEVEEAMALGLEYAKKMNAELLLATDPDCDRVGIAVRTPKGEYTLLSGNETGILLLDYICSRKKAMGIMPQDPVFIKTIVTSDMAERIAGSYGVHTINVLTGFKFIGEQIGLLEKKGQEDSFLLGFEESFGYLSGAYVRDKDGVNGAFLICEMFAYYKSLGIGLYEKLEELYQKYGYSLNTLHSITFAGAAGKKKMQEIMKRLRQEADSFGGKQILDCQDYAEGRDGLPKADVLKFILASNCSVVVRPSGTEPKMKIYISVTGANRAAAVDEEKEIWERVLTKLQNENL